ncbi:MAG: ABC transporter permease, partial [Clostridia bacterium]|nr:ABC transporter permease [Clostridia bacterium]
MKGLVNVASFTIKDMIKRKSFIVSNIIILLLIVLAFNVPNILDAVSGDNPVEEGTKILIVDADNVFEGSLSMIKDMETGYNAEITNENVNFEQIKEKIENDEIKEAIVVKEENGKINLEYIVENLVYVKEMPESLVNILSTLYSNVQISKLGLTSEQVASLTPNFEFKLSQTEDKEVQGNPVVVMLLSIVLFYAVYFCAYQVSASITTEKTSKIIETLVTSTKPSTIVLGKTI